MRKIYWQGFVAGALTQVAAIVLGLAIGISGALAQGKPAGKPAYNPARPHDGKPYTTQTVVNPKTGAPLYRIEPNIGLGRGYFVVDPKTGERLAEIR